MFFKKKKPKVSAPAPEATTGLPAIDPQKLIEASDRLQKMIEAENENRQQRLAQLEETAGKLNAATDAILRKSEAVLEENEKAATDWRAQGCPTTKEVTVMAPLKIKTPPKP